MQLTTEIFPCLSVTRQRQGQRAPGACTSGIDMSMVKGARTSSISNSDIGVEKFVAAVADTLTAKRSRGGCCNPHSHTPSHPATQWCKDS